MVMRIFAREDEVPKELRRFMERLRVSREANMLFSHDTPLEISRRNVDFHRRFWRSYVEILTDRLDPAVRELFEEGL